MRCFDEALRLDPEFLIARASPLVHRDVSTTLMALERYPEAIEHIHQGLALDPSLEVRRLLQFNLKSCLLEQRRWDEAQPVWRALLDTNPADHVFWYGYAELCLYLGLEDEYQRAREALLARFGDAADPYVAERVARAFLLRPASGDVLQRASALTDRAIAVDRSTHAGVYPHFMFVRGLAKYRQGHLQEAIAIMRGDASRARGTAPRLVQAKALHGSGNADEARTTLAAAVGGYKWTEDQVKDEDGWILVVLRREAEAMISATANRSWSVHRSLTDSFDSDSPLSSSPPDWDSLSVPWGIDWWREDRIAISRRFERSCRGAILPNL